MERSSVAPRRGRAVLVLRLYVAGNGPNSLRAISNIRAICDEHFTAAHKLEIVDSLEEPGRALEDGIVVTPTLVRLLPKPGLRVIGDLSDSGQVLTSLGGS